MKTIPALTPDPVGTLLEMMSDFMLFTFHTASMITGLPEDLLQGLLCDFVASDLLTLSVNEEGLIVYERV